MTHILVATDAWHPQVNGVVRTLTAMAEAAKGLGVDISFLTPQSFRTFAMPSYPDLRLALPRPGRIAAQIKAARPDSIHIATEGPIGLMVRRYCRKHGLPFTTSFHTRFPEYVSARSSIPEAWVWRALRAFHRPSQAVMAATPALAAELRLRGFRNVVLWSRGVDTSLFHPRAVDLCLPTPVFLSVGRVAVEKISKLSSISICPAPSSLSAMVRPGRRWSESTLTPCSSVRGTARNSRQSMRQPMSSCSRAGPTPLAWCCWRRLPAACRLPLFRSPVPVT